MKKCKNADAYKAIRPPKCGAGKPCDACAAKWIEHRPLDGVCLGGYPRKSR